MTKNSVHETQLTTNINEKANTYSDTENRILIRNGEIVGLLTKNLAHKKLQSCFNIWLEGKNSVHELSDNIVCDNFIFPLLIEGHRFFQSRVDNQGNEHFDPCETSKILFQVLTCYIKKSKKSSSNNRKLKDDDFNKSEERPTTNGQKAMKGLSKDIYFIEGYYRNEYINTKIDEIILKNGIIDCKQVLEKIVILLHNEGHRFVSCKMKKGKIWNFVEIPLRNEKDKEALAKKIAASALRTESICAQPMENDVIIKNSKRDIFTERVNSESKKVYDSKERGEKFTYVEGIVKGIVEERIQGKGNFFKFKEGLIEEGAVIQAEGYYRILLEIDEVMVALVIKVQQKFRNFIKPEEYKKQSKNSDHQEDDIDHRQSSSSNLSPRILPGMSTVSQIPFEYGCGFEITPAGHTNRHYYENKSSKRSASLEREAHTAKKPCNVNEGCMETLPFTIEPQDIAYLLN